MLLSIQRKKKEKKNERILLITSQYIASNRFS